MTLPPVAVAAIVTAMWTWTDYEIKKMQPYVDLSHGDSPPHRSLLLDYTRSNNFFTFPKATRNRHYVVALASLMVILTLTFQPLAAALLETRQTWWSLPSMDLTQLMQVGLNQGQDFGDLSAFLTAAGFASASVMYTNLPPPRFISVPYTVAPFQLPSTDTAQGGIEANGTVLFANSTAIKSIAGCEPLDVNMTPVGNSGNWDNSIDSNGCALNWTVTRESDFLFGANTTLCSGSSPDAGQPTQFAPIVFWFFSYDPTPRASATVCRPRIELWDVTIQMELVSQNITSVKELQPFSASSSNFSSASGNITGAPLNGRAYNGIAFNLSTPVDPFVEARREAIQVQLPASVFQLARSSSGGLQSSFDQNIFVGLSTNVYLTYLTLLAQTVYLVPPPSTEINTVQAKTVMDRVFLSSTATHLLAVALLLLALFCTIIQLFHRYDRRSLYLPPSFEPGTIASAVTVGAQTGMGELLAEVREKSMYRNATSPDGRSGKSGRSEKDVVTQVLGQKKFRIDPETMKIVMEGEIGYEWARSPNRKSVFFPSNEGGVGARLSRRLSSWGGVGGTSNEGGSERAKSPLNPIPGSPRSPKSPKSPKGTTGAGEV
ncbi:hypothetical protein K435DRAFT_797270 [Dendrothele bispora CBS 962.96]|uniref:Uncharacterized protein n=1 Tax=Dendrothele bispora (strain CBS 962.96) TaxID=1314807 RepID=A0A4S8M305_DENBC|nr:hypothetical protein K435DRAFT_797270 [Dendrothele bispora CBS 962.96]